MYLLPATRAVMVPAPRPYIRGLAIMSIDLSDFSPIADILVLEKRNCSKCHFGSYQPSGIMRLWTSHRGPFRHAMIPRKSDETPLSIRGTRVVETLVESCPNCWKANWTWEELVSIIPEPPTERSFPLEVKSLAERRLAEAIARANAPGVSKQARARIVASITPRPILTLASLFATIRKGSTP